MTILSRFDMLTKVCKVCGRRKPLTDFYLNHTYADWHTWACKVCIKVKQKTHRETHPEIYQKRKAYFDSPHGRALMYANIKIYQQRHPEKRKAHVWVGNAIRDGRLIRELCEKCGGEKVTAHHDDYSKPTEVRWLCGLCHRAHHKAEREASR